MNSLTDSRPEAVPLEGEYRAHGSPLENPHAPHPHDERFVDSAARHIRDHLGLLSAMSRRLAQDIVEPEDLLQDAILNLLERYANSAERPESINAYLIRSMRNRVIDLIRSPSRQVKSFDPAYLPAVATHARAVVPETTWVATEVRRALDALPPLQREIAVQVLVLGRKPGDVAAETGRAPDAVYSALRRARRALQAALADV